MYEHSQSRWSCQLCSHAFPTKESLRADLQAHQVLVRDLITELKGAEAHSQYQPLSSSSEDENDQSLTLRTKTASNASFNSASKYRCPYDGCTQNEEMHKNSLNRHYTNHISISENCGFCREHFGILRRFVTHIDKNCKERKRLREKGKRLNEEQYRTIRHKDELCKESNRQLNEQLNQQLNIKGTAGDESSVAGDARSYSNGIMKGGNEGATAQSLASGGRIGGEGTRGSTELDNSADETAMRAEEQRPLQKRRRTDTIVIQSDEQRPIENECAEAQLSSREHDNDIENTISSGTVIVAENSQPSTSGSSNISLTNTTLVPTLHIPSQTVRSLDLEDLFSFLKSYHGGCAPLAIQLCSYDLSLLPSNKVKFGSSKRPEVTILLATQVYTDLIGHIIEEGRSKLEFGL